MGLDALRDDMRYSQRAGLPFIITAAIIWGFIAIATSINLPMYTSDLVVFCCACPLMPIAMLVGKILKVDILDKKNPLWKAGILFTCNQMIYLLVAMWVMSAMPEKMVMVYAMIFGAHYLPYSWLYKEKFYLVSAILITVTSLVLGLMVPRNVLAVVLMCYEIVFAVVLCRTTRK
ncbi:MAG: hypothetical protein IKR39_11005 [Lachnospiraceae bacterium]|nr:hypothetical protein [Lachnospiraceae bacterium]